MNYFFTLPLIIIWLILSDLSVFQESENAIGASILFQRDLQK